MRHRIKMAVLAGAALAAAGCNRQATVTNNATNEVGQSEDQVRPGNDASAVESVNTTPEPPREAPPANTAADDPGAANPGGDTGGNSLDVETNTPGI
ncbi:MAG: hypothetical protein QOD42_3266 [Sphingomonadales bacterium]|jgi:hypothetical protein|nr:hypothetical protein [Sphingomonadales bacterium]